MLKRIVGAKCLRLRGALRMAAIVAAALACLSLPARAAAAETAPALAAWLQSQSSLKTWTADFTQTRTLKALTQPLKATGKVWFAAPNKFRWELGQPAQTLAVRQPEQMMVIYPKLKRVEKYPLNAESAGPWKDALALLEAGFPRSQAELESRFEIAAFSVTNNVGLLALVPRSLTARKMMPQIRIDFSTTDHSLRATELTFADGSTMRNDFTNSQLNPGIEDTVFEPKLEADFKIIEPMKPAARK